MDDRITSLEERIAHLTRAVEDLSDLVRIQGQAVDRLSARLQRLVEREAERDVEAGEQVPLADQRPPHW